MLQKYVNRGAGVRFGVVSHSREQKQIKVSILTRKWFRARLGETCDVLYLLLSLWEDLEYDVSISISRMRTKKTRNLSHEVKYNRFERITSLICRGNEKTLLMMSQYLLVLVIRTLEKDMDTDIARERSTKKSHQSPNAK